MCVFCSHCMKTLLKNSCSKSSFAGFCSFERRQNPSLGCLQSGKAFIFEVDGDEAGYLVGFCWICLLEEPHVRAWFLFTSWAWAKFLRVWVSRYDKHRWFGFSRGNQQLPRHQCLQGKKNIRCLHAAWFCHGNRLLFFLIFLQKAFQAAFGVRWRLLRGQCLCEVWWSTLWRFPLSWTPSLEHEGREAGTFQLFLKWIRLGCCFSWCFLPI